MGVPKKRTSAQKRDQRRANWKITAPNVSACSACGEPIQSHRVCPSCGSYGGKKVIEKAAS
jgi:large subunit ribosomal protein L32